MNDIFFDILCVLREKKGDNKRVFPLWVPGTISHNVSNAFSDAGYTNLSLDSLAKSYESMIQRNGGIFQIADFNAAEDAISIDHSSDPHLNDDALPEIVTTAVSPAEVETFTKDDAMVDLFMEEKEFDFIMERLKLKKNIIIQGPPGVGKTYLAKRLAYLLMGVIDEDRVVMIQFHQSYSYEDFIQGYRPTKDRNFALRSGIFYKFCENAKKDESKPWIFIIDEINRGNLSKIFGEILMLIEADKRGRKFAVPLTYGEEKKGKFPKFHIPSNVYLIGTMNTADRSLAMVDYALRRRFSFIDLEPQFDNPLFEEFLISNNVEEEIFKKIKKNMNAVNTAIAKDTKNLGSGYKIGHSYFCPTDNKRDTKQTYDENWYQMVIKSEIKPLLKEYWFDNSEIADKFVKRLLS